MNILHSPAARGLVLCLAALALAPQASATTYQFKVAANGLKSPLVAPAIADPTPWTVVYGTPATRIQALVSSSSGAFSYTSGNPSVATVNGDWVTFAAAGTATITAKQAATASHTAGQAAISLTVLKAPANLQALTIPAKTTVDGTFALATPTSASPAPVVYASSNPSVATVAGSSVTIVGEGSTTITATQAATSNFNAATQSAVLVVSPPPLPAGYFKVGALTWTSRHTTILNYAAAVTYCSGTFNGQTGWRLSTVAEMRAANSAGAMNNFGGGNSWNQKVDATFYYSQLGQTAYSGYDSSHGGHTLNVFCVK